MSFISSNTDSQSLEPFRDYTVDHSLIKTAPLLLDMLTAALSCPWCGSCKRGPAVRKWCRRTFFEHALWTWLLCFVL